MVLKLYGASLSTCTRRVATVLHEKNIPYELHTVDFATGEHKSAAYLTKQPFGQLPYIDDDGLILFESRAICRYLEAKYPNKGPRLAPPTSDLAAYARYEQACSVETANFDVYASSAVAELVFKPMRGVESNKALADGLLKTLEAKLDGYEAILSKQKYLAGNEITLADIFHLPYGSMLERIGFTVLENGSKPNVTRWWKDITSRPAWNAVKGGVPAEGIKA
ncbi:glutathione S-transferase [Vararia minispora EC-137]|uniref:Glutathione S-transferase n=1 Tax=Vararia minispora EC-137 TaxID=1314806 RepID=A0ACB8QLC6_9AGAM|nr:glutathione S-transferase [Vararia minispora EC-137]